MGAPRSANHARWLISYADFITLLFAFFVVMFASAQTDKAKAQQISDFWKDAVGKGAPKLTAEQLTAAAKLAELTSSLRILESRLKPEIDNGALKVSMEPRGIVISLRQAAFFPSGQDAIDVARYPTVEKLAEVILAVPNKVRLEGHTDAVPIRNPRYRSNWELSAARGVTMLEVLTARYHVPQDRLSVAGYAETIPITTNDTPEGRAQNRRVDVVILNENGLKGEPGALK